jgi:hypothetical protein
VAETYYPERFIEFLEFLCAKHEVDRSQVFTEYSSKPPPPVKGGRLGYYDGLLSSRKKGNRIEFLITVFKIAHDPLLTLGHEFAHLVDDLKSQNIGKPLGPPDDGRETEFDNRARLDLDEFIMQSKIDGLKRSY